METDNQWHDAICAKHGDGSFGIYDDMQDAMKRGLGKFPADEVEYQNVKYNWNQGLPIVDFGKFQMCIRNIVTT